MDKSIFNINHEIKQDDSIRKIEYIEYDSKNTVADAPGDTHFLIQNQDEYLLPSRSYIYLEGMLSMKKDGKPYGENAAGSGADAGKTYVNLVNNALMYLFERVDYQLGNNKIEGYDYPGQATTLKSLITYPREYNEGEQFLWIPDRGAKGCVKGNPGYSSRHNLIMKNPYPPGSFSAVIPLSHIFGFAENYNKVSYGLKHELTLRRRVASDDAILKSPEKDASGNDLVPDGQIQLTKLTWRMPHVKPSDAYLIKLAKKIQGNDSVDIEFENRQCERYAMTPNSTQLDWRLNVAAGSEKPRLILLAFQEDRDDSQLKNPAIFDHMKVSNAFVQLNSERYPEMDLALDFENNKATTSFSMLTDYYRDILGKESLPITLQEYMNLYPVFLFDVSKQSERLKNSVTDIKIKATFKKNIPTNVMAYALILSDRTVKLKSDGTKMNVIY